MRNESLVVLWLILCLPRIAWGQERTILEGHKGVVRAVAFTPDGKILASGGGEDRDGELMLWDVVTGKNRTNLYGNFAQVTGVAFTPDGKTLASVSLGGYIQLWEVATGKNTMTFPRPDVFPEHIAFCPDNKTLISVGSSNKIPCEVNLWEVTTGKNTASYQPDFVKPSVKSLAFSADGKTIAFSLRYSYEVPIMDLATGKKTRSISSNEPSGGNSWRVAFSPNGKILATGEETGSNNWSLGRGDWQVNSYSQGP